MMNAVNTTQRMRRKERHKFSRTMAVILGLIGLFRFDLVAFLFGDMSWFSRIVYVLVGISGLYLISFFLHLGDSEA